MKKALLFALLTSSPFLLQAKSRAESDPCPPYDLATVRLVPSIELTQGTAYMGRFTGYANGLMSFTLDDERTLTIGWGEPTLPDGIVVDAVVRIVDNVDYFTNVSFLASGWTLSTFQAGGFTGPDGPFTVPGTDKTIELAERWQCSVRDAIVTHADETTTRLGPNERMPTGCEKGELHFIAAVSSGGDMETHGCGAFKSTTVREGYFNWQMTSTCKVTPTQ